MQISDGSGVDLMRYACRPKLVHSLGYIPNTKSVANRDGGDKQEWPKWITPSHAECSAATSSTQQLEIQQKQQQKKKQKCDYKLTYD